MIHTSLDDYTTNQTKSIGENGHIQNGWATSCRERIVQLSFQITRTETKKELDQIGYKFRELIKDIIVQKTSLGDAQYHELLLTLYKLIAQTRDIVEGKGEYTIAHIMLISWYDYFPQSAFFMLDSFVLHNEHPFGSWKDIKYICNIAYVRNPSHPLITHCVELTNNQLRKDVESLASSLRLSLVAKWIPREGTKRFGWLFDRLAENYFSEFLSINNNEKAVRKCKTHYRKLVASINKELDTVQIKQCANTWAEIDPTKQTSLTMKRQTNAFLNITKTPNVKRSVETDRIICADHFKQHIDRAKKGETEIKGKRVGLNEMVKTAIEYCNSPTTQKYAIDMLNLQWQNNALQTNVLQKMIPMVDVSGSMDGDPMHAAIGLGIRVSEKSIIGNRVMTFSETPAWVNLDGATDFVSKVGIIRKANWGGTTDFYVALKLILDVIVKNKIPHEDVEGMTLAIFSDMQIDTASGSRNKQTMFENIDKEYRDAGIKVNGIPYKTPHILFWNLRVTQGFPSLATQANTSMMSGFSPALLNTFCENGAHAFRDPWLMLMTTLSKTRYAFLENIPF